jgi:hypothetical protein
MGTVSERLSPAAEHEPQRIISLDSVTLIWYKTGTLEKCVLRQAQDERVLGALHEVREWGQLRVTVPEEVRSRIASGMMGNQGRAAFAVAAFSLPARDWE